MGSRTVHRKVHIAKIVYILDDPEYCKEGYVVLGLEPCAIKTRGEVRENNFVINERQVPVYER